MENTEASAWTERDLWELSGGERQRVYVAMALAQETEVIFLDKPTTCLDLGRQFEVLELIRALYARGKTIVMVLHDLAGVQPSGGPDGEGAAGAVRQSSGAV